MTRCRRVVAATALVTALALGAASPARAAWLSSTGAASAATGRADAVPAASSPTTSTTGSTASLSWSAVSLGGGAPVTGYRVTRVDTTTAAVTPATGACAGTVTATSCAEAGLPTGRWAYRLEAVRGAWVGPPGPLGPTVAVDATPPTIAAAVLQKSSGGATGAIRQGGTYRLYAAVADLAAVTSGVSSVRANASALTAGASNVALSSGSWTIGGTSYGYRSAQLTAANPLAAGTRAFTVTAVDGDGNGVTSPPVPVVVDNVGPSGVDVQVTNGGPTPGRAETGDVIRLTFSEPIDPDAVLAGWTGEGSSVTVRLTNNGGGDRIQVRQGGTLPLGTVFLGHTGYVTGTRNFTGSIMTLVGSTVEIVLGAPSGATGTVTTPTTASWTPSGSAYDPAGNAASTSSVAETGGADVQF